MTELSKEQIEKIAKRKPLCRADAEDNWEIVAVMEPEERDSLCALALEALASRKIVEAADTMAVALDEIKLGRGRFRRDPLEHATNVIEEAKALASDAVAAYRAAKDNANA